MDNICTTYASRQKADEGFIRTKDIFPETDMEIHKGSIVGEASLDTKVLGMSWNTEIDLLTVVVPDLACPTTKSERLSAASKPSTSWG